MGKLITCAVCGKQYEYCQNCDKYRNFWKTTYCCENCKNIYDVCSKYAFKHIDKATARKELSNLDISKIENFHPSLQANIFDILEDDGSANNEKPINTNANTDSDKVAVSENKNINEYKNEPKKKFNSRKMKKNY